MSLGAVVYGSMRKRLCHAAQAACTLCKGMEVKTHSIAPTGSMQLCKLWLLVDPGQQNIYARPQAHRAV